MMGVTPSFLRNNYHEDDVDSSDQPIDFSKKYCETKMNENKAMKGPHETNRNCTFNKVVKSYNTTFTMYAETDLDQPTDYSLRYAEDDSDSEVCNKISKTETAEFVQDTIKTYCTEDTPYETPFNFSTSTSMSDLRIDDKAPINSKIDSETKHTNTKEVANVDQLSPDKVVKSEYSSGLMSPEKPVNYCEEGTPGYFSRVASCGSLNLIPVNDSAKQELKEDNLIDKACDKEPRRVNKFASEPKAVKFEEVVNYAEETPLMFSRSSSLASLDSIEQHSIHDDRSSVISDFSRLTSGLISPSELPDSPSQTIPPSPKPRKSPLVFPQVAKKKTENEPDQSSNVPKSSVFEDVVKKFKMESTPLQFSTATSLSSLIIDDHEDVDSKSHHEQQSHLAENDSVNKVDNNDLSNLDINNDLSESSEDEDILAACINIGMQNNRYSQQKSSTPPPVEVPNFKFATDVVNNLRLTPNNSPQHLIVASAMTVPRSSIEVTQSSSVQKSDMTSDSVRTYCTEDTPAILSLAGSNSDLSLLSMHVDQKIADNVVNDEDDVVNQVKNLKLNDVKDCPEDEKEKDNLNVAVDIEPNEDSQSRRSSFSSLSEASHESEKALLEECILAGMPKANSSSPIKPNLTIVNSSSEKSTELEESPTTLLNMQKTIVDNESSDEEDQNILADCINSGMKNNRYSQAKLNICPANYSNFHQTKANHNRVTLSESLPVKNGKPEAAKDSIKRYYTEDTPAGLSHAGSGSDLSVLSAQVANENGVEKDDVSDFNSNLSDDDDESLLMECVRYGMAKIAGAAVFNQLQKVEGNNGLISVKNYLEDSPKRAAAREKVDLNISVENNVSDDDSRSFSSISEESYESEQALLQECILAGMPKRSPHRRPPSTTVVDPNELTAAEKALLHQCILEGMRKCRIGPPSNTTTTTTNAAAKKQPSPIEDDTSDLTEAERALLRQCILAGMPKNKNLSVGGPSAAAAPRESTTELTESERLLLQQCILAGMPKSRTTQAGKFGGSGRHWSRRPREAAPERGGDQGAGHTCCIHCPRNIQNRMMMMRQNTNHVSRRRRYRERGQVQIRETRDINILYVTSQILAMKKEVVDRSREEWV